MLFRSAAAALATRNGRIGVLATEATVRSGAYFAAIKDENPTLQVADRAASTLVPLIERGELDSPRLRDAVAEVLRPFATAPAHARVDTMLLGCTHFPLIRDVIADQLGPSVAVVDSAAAAAATLREVVAVNHLDAAWVMALRLAIGAFLLVPYSLVAGQSLRAPAAVWAKFSWLGFIGHALPFFLISWGTFHVSSGVSGLLMAAIPLFIIVLAHFFLPDEPLTLPKTVGFLLGFVEIGRAHV